MEFRAWLKLYPLLAICRANNVNISFEQIHEGMQLMSRGLYVRLHFPEVNSHYQLVILDEHSSWESYMDGTVDKLIAIITGGVKLK